MAAEAMEGSLELSARHLHQPLSISPAAGANAGSTGFVGAWVFCGTLALEAQSKVN